MTHITFRLTAKNRDQLRNPMPGNRVGATFSVYQSTHKVWLSIVLTTLWQSKQDVRNPQEEKEERDAGEQQRHALSIQLLSLNATRLKIEPETVISSLANCQWTVYGLRTIRSIDQYVDATTACKCFARQRTCVANGNAALPQQPADTGQLAAYSLHPSEILRIQFSCQVRRIIEQIGGEPQRLLVSGSPGWKSIMPRPGKEAPPVNKASHQRGKPSRPFGKLLYSLTVKTLTVWTN